MSARKKTGAPGANADALEALRRENEYLRRSAKETAGRLLSLEAQSIVMRHELEQKRRGFSLMAELTVSLGRESDYQGIFESVSRRINTILTMQRTAVLLPDGSGSFQARILQGYSEEEAEEISALRIKAPEEILDPRHPVLVTGADPAERLAGFRSGLRLPFLISCPIFLQGEVAAILVTGRLLEQRPYLLRLGASDVETVQTVCAYLAAMLTGQRLREAEQRTQIMLDAMPMGCVFWDKACRHIDCNEAAPRLFDLGGKEEFLERFWELVPEKQPDGQPSTEMVYEKMRAVRELGAARFEFMHRKTNGEPLPVEVTLEPVRYGRDNIVVAYLRDLREMKAVLSEIYKTQDELRRARDLAEKNARAKSEFLANMSHEIRTPMNAIVGMTHLLAGTGLNGKQKNYVEKAEHSAKLLLHIINDILDFTKIEAGRLDMENIGFSLRQVAANVHDIIAGQAAAKSLGWSIAVDAEVPDRLVGDPLRLEQVLINLANNAVKFTPAGTVDIRVYLPGGSPAASGPVEIAFAVRDTGIGLSAEQLSRLFSPFTQADTSITRKYGGTGLGLAISRSLVELMGGHIGCESAQGRGSVFTFTVRLGQCAEPVDGQLCRPVADDTGADCLKGIRVLLAEDNEINQMIATEMLENRGASVRAASTGLEALRALEETDYDVVLMDIQMPELDGLSTAARIRADPRWEKLPLIAMTAHAMSGDREISLESGMDDHLTKPIDPAKLYAAVKRWTGK